MEFPRYARIRSKAKVQGGKVGGPDDPSLDALTRLRKRLEEKGQSLQGFLEESLEKTKNDPPQTDGNKKKPL